MTSTTTVLAGWTTGDSEPNGRAGTRPVSQFTDKRTLAAKNLTLVPLLYLWAFVPIIAAITLIQISLSRLAPPRLIQIMTGGA